MSLAEAVQQLAAEIKWEDTLGQELGVVLADNVAGSATDKLVRVLEARMSRLAQARRAAEPGGSFSEYADLLRVSISSDCARPARM